MKKLKLILLFLLVFTLSKAQEVVTDPVETELMIQQNAAQTQQNITSSNNYIEAIQHTVWLKNTLSFLKSADSVLVKVKTEVATVYYIKQIANREIILIGKASTYCSQIRKMKTLTSSETSLYLYNINTILNNTQQMVDLASKLVKDNFFKMNDSERIKHAQDICVHLDEQEAVMDYNYGSVENLEKERNMRMATYSFVNPVNFYSYGQCGL